MIKAAAVLVTRKETAERTRTRLRSGHWEMQEEGALGKEVAEEQFVRECGVEKEEQSLSKSKGGQQCAGLQGLVH